MIAVTRRLRFCAGHRVAGHENKCAHLHGHNYEVEIIAQAEGLDHLGRVIDFSVLKQRVGGWIDEHWDHAFIAWEEDGVMGMVIDLLEDQHEAGRIPRPRVYWLPTNPTAENLAAFLLRVVCPEVLRGTGVTVASVVVVETENCWAEAGLP